MCKLCIVHIVYAWTDNVCIIVIVLHAHTLSLTHSISGERRYVRPLCASSFISVLQEWHDMLLTSLASSLHFSVMLVASSAGRMDAGRRFFALSLDGWKVA